jgi:hypothetical protein
LVVNCDVTRSPSIQWHRHGKESVPLEIVGLCEVFPEWLHTHSLSLTHTILRLLASWQTMHRFCSNLLPVQISCQNIMAWSKWDSCHTSHVTNSDISLFNEKVPWFTPHFYQFCWKMDVFNTCITTIIRCVRCSTLKQSKLTLLLGFRCLHECRQRLRGTPPRWNKFMVIVMV